MDVETYSMPGNEAIHADGRGDAALLGAGIPVHWEPCLIH